MFGLRMSVCCMSMHGKYVCMFDSTHGQPVNWRPADGSFALCNSAHWHLANKLCEHVYSAHAHISHPRIPQRYILNCDVFDSNILKKGWLIMYVWYPCARCACAGPSDNARAEYPCAGCPCAESFYAECLLTIFFRIRCSRLCRSYQLSHTSSRTIQTFLIMTSLTRKSFIGTTWTLKVCIKTFRTAFICTRKLCTRKFCARIWSTLTLRGRTSLQGFLTECFRIGSPCGGCLCKDRQCGKSVCRISICGIVWKMNLFGMAWYKMSACEMALSGMSVC